MLSEHICELAVEHFSKDTPTIAVALLRPRRCQCSLFLVPPVTLCLNPHARYPELLTYLSNSAIDVAVVLESKWQECMEYTTGPWSCIHSGCKSRKEAGILVLVRQSMAPASQLRYEHLLQGRVVHVRVPLQGSEARHLHIIGVYQKVHNPKPPAWTRDSKFGRLCTGVCTV